MCLVNLTVLIESPTRVLISYEGRRSMNLIIIDLINFILFFNGDPLTVPKKNRMTVRMG